MDIDFQINSIIEGNIQKEIPKQDQQTTQQQINSQKIVIGQDQLQNLDLMVPENNNDNQNLNIQQQQHQQNLYEIVKRKSKKLPKEITNFQGKEIYQNKLNLEGFEVYFPYKSYTVQECYISYVLKSLNEKKNALLQSPTGSGKTISLLTSSLTWLQSKRLQQIQNKEEIPCKIIYASRTHSQLKQAIRELKKTIFNPKISHLASREIYCINDQILNQYKGSALNSVCKSACASKKCAYYEGMKHKPQLKKHFQNIMDIEELKQAASSQLFCPWHYTNNLKAQSDIIFLPYDYIFQQKLFSVEDKINLQNSILIFDEAHNITKNAEDSNSYQISLNMLSNAEEIVKNMINNDGIAKIKIKLAREFLNPLQKFKAYLGGILQQYNQQKQHDIDQEKGFQKPGREIFNLLSDNTKYDLMLGYKCQSNINQIKNKKKKSSKYIKKSKGDLKWFTKQYLGNNNNNLEQFGFSYSKVQQDGENQQQQLDQPETPKVKEKELIKQSKVDNMHQDLVIEDYFSSRDISQFYANGLNMNSMSRYLDVCNNMLNFLVQENTYGIECWIQFLKGVYELMLINHIHKQSDSELENYINHYFVQVQIEDYIDNQEKKYTEQCLEGASNEEAQLLLKILQKKDHSDRQNCVMNLLCFNPAIAFKRILKEEPYNFILTSGTMTPFNSWERELKIQFPITLATGHVVNAQENLLAGLVISGRGGHKLNFSYESRNNEKNISEIYKSVGNLLVDVSSIIPNGILVFFASYKMLSEAKENWEKTNLWNSITKIKPIMYEQKGAEQTELCINQYSQLAKESSKGAILLAVCKGKLSEGIDFTDELARAVFIVGIPFPPCFNQQIVLKKQYLDQAKSKLKDQKGLTGTEWYMQQTIRSVNQTVGRVIRHSQDFGAIYFCDLRYDQNKDLKQNISGWIIGENCKNLKVWQNYSALLSDTVQFFKRNQKHLTNGDPIIEQKQMDAVQHENQQNKENFFKNDQSIEKKTQTKKKNKQQTICISLSSASSQQEDIKEEQTNLNTRDDIDDNNNENLIKQLLEKYNKKTKIQNNFCQYTNDSNSFFSKEQIVSNKDKQTIKQDINQKKLANKYYQCEQNLEGLKQPVQINLDKNCNDKQVIYNNKPTFINDKSNLNLNVLNVNKNDNLDLNKLKFQNEKITLINQQQSLINQENQVFNCEKQKYNCEKIALINETISDQHVTHTLKNNHETNLHIKIIEKCQVCLKTIKLYGTTGCNHKLCRKCWRSQFTRSFSCPICFATIKIIRQHKEKNIFPKQILQNQFKQKF